MSKVFEHFSSRAQLIASTIDRECSVSYLGLGVCCLPYSEAANKGTGLFSSESVRFFNFPCKVVLGGFLRTATPT